MKSIGIICEFNPLHNGHVYFINSIKKKYPDYILILILNGYFLERGEVSVLSKEDKTKLSLEFGVDIVLELPVIYGTQSADVFGETSVKILNNFNIEKLIFGSESDNIEILKEIANKQLYDNKYDDEVKKLLASGINYPTALAKALNMDEFVYSPNDLLGISYVKAIIKNNYNIEVETIKRTNGFHDNILEDEIVSASNIREKYFDGKEIVKYLPKDYKDIITKDFYSKYFNILKYKIITSDNLDEYLDVNEGIENRLKKEICNADNIDDYIKLIKNKRITYNKINRMFIHILLGIKKDFVKDLDLDYIKVLGFNKKGVKYINFVKKNVEIPINVDKSSNIYKYELIAAKIYQLLTDKDTYNYENGNKPIKYEE